VPFATRKHRKTPANPRFEGSPEVTLAGPGDHERGTEDEKGLSDLAEGYRKATPYLAASTSLVAAVGVFTGLGVWLDKKFDTSPWLTLLGAALGMTGGFISFFKAVLGTRTRRP
jgi:F0F1-type ATP synthase assembly protein I